MRSILLSLTLSLISSAAVSSLHPRIYVRADSATVGKGIKVSELRRRAHDPAFAAWRKSIPDIGITSQVERAARYLEDGNPADLASVRDFLKTHTFSYRTHDVGGLLAGAEMAMAYDWIYHGLSDEDRKAILANIVTTADSSASQVRHPEVNHNYTYMALNTVATCGLVLKGEPEPYNTKGEEYLALARKTIEEPGMVLDTWKAREGTWSEGSHYTFHETLRNVILMFQAYRTASDADYFARIAQDYGNFVVKAGWFLTGSTRPDLTFERTGDTSWSRVFTAITVPLTVEMMASGITDRDEAARLRSFSRDIQDAYGDKALHSTFAWGMRMFLDPGAPLTPSYKTLPLGMRLGKGTYEQIVFRNGWGPDSTKIAIIAGDHFTDHQHFDKGQFLIYRHGGLAVDSGAYDGGMYKAGSHWNEYSTRTLAHNCLLVRDPTEQFPRGATNDGGQRVLRGLQHHPNWQTYLDHYKREHLDTSEVESYAFEPGKYGYVRVNLKGAYSDKVTAYDRQFVYLPGPDYLVIMDRVSAAEADFAKRWLVHFLDRPEIDGKVPEPGVTPYPGAQTTTVKRNSELDLGAKTVNYDGAMSIQTVLPLKRAITVVGGPGYEFYNAFDKVNYPLSRNDPNAAARESGAWRIEIAPAEPAKDDVFLNVLQIGKEKPVAARLLEAKGATAVQTGNQVIAFAGTEARYTVEAAGPTDHIIAGLPASASLLLGINGKARRVMATSEGVLTFTDKGRGRRTISLKQQNRG